MKKVLKFMLAILKALGNIIPSILRATGVITQKEKDTIDETLDTIEETIEDNIKEKK